MLSALLILLPAIVLVVPLLARRYPGERELLALRRRERPPLPRPALAMADHGRHEDAVPRGGLLLGLSLAVRPPPLAAAVS